MRAHSHQVITAAIDNNTSHALHVLYYKYNSLARFDADILKRHGIKCNFYTEYPSEEVYITFKIYGFGDSEILVKAMQQTGEDFFSRLTREP